MDNGIQFAEPPRNRNSVFSRPMRFDMICEANGIEHRLAKPNHPWTNGPPLSDCKQSPAGHRVERMNPTFKEATVKRFHYHNHDQPRTHLADFMATYNVVRRKRTVAASAAVERKTFGPLP